MKTLASEPTLRPTVAPFKSRETITASSGWILFVVFWIVSCLGGLALATMAGQPFLGILVAGLPTLIGVVVSPTFALCCIALMLPQGGALTYEGFLSGDRVIGGIAAVGILVHSMISGQGIRLKGSPLLPLFLIAAWGTFSCLWAAYPLPALYKALQLIQLSIWGLAIWNALAYRQGHIWPLRCYLCGTLLVLSHMFLTGSIQSMAHSAERITVGEGVNPGKFAIILGITFFVSVYLIIRDPVKKFRLLWILPALISPAVMIQTGSRGPMLAFAIAVIVSLLSFRAFLQSKAIMFGSVLMILLFIGGVFWSLRGGFASESSVDRLTSSAYRERSFAYRFYLVKNGIGHILARPLTGAGLENYLLRVGQKNIVHVDIVHLGTELGIPAMLLYIWFLFKLIATFRQNESPPEKWLMRTLVILLAISACGHVLFFKKVFWFFTIGSAAICYRVQLSNQSRRAIQ